VLPAAAAAVPTGVRVLSAGAEIGTARYAAAKLVELTRIPAWAGDLEEFAHSQYWSMPTTDLVVVLATDAALARYAGGTCEALRQLGVRTLAIDTVETAVSSAATRVGLPPLAPEIAPLASAIPLQLLAYGLAESSGLDPDTRLHLKNDEARFRVSRLLTRRSLVGTGR
jgi:glucosamine 6-phosphate synthetase-like amidotransferase/phosphosugar isomerase protein